MGGSVKPSQFETWDPKPELKKYDDKTIPGHDGLAFGSPFEFKKSGKSGVEVSDVFPKLGEVIDDNRDDSKQHYCSDAPP